MKRNPKTYYDVYERPYEGDLYDDYPLDKLVDEFYPEERFNKYRHCNVIMHKLCHYLLEYDLSFDNKTCSRIIETYPEDGLSCLFTADFAINRYLKSLKLFILNQYEFYDQCEDWIDNSPDSIVDDRPLYYKNADGVITDNTYRYETLDEGIRRIDYYFERMCKEFGTKYPWYKRLVKKVIAIIITLFKYIKNKQIRQFYFDHLTGLFNKILSW